MPRENRKRGKKHKSKANDEIPAYNEPEAEVETQAGPSWIVPASEEESEFNPEAPFGYVDVDVKAYFRTVDIQIRDWQENEVEPQAGDGTQDPNAGKNSRGW